MQSNLNSARSDLNKVLEDQHDFWNRKNELEKALSWKWKLVYLSKAFISDWVTRTAEQTRNVTTASVNG